MLQVDKVLDLSTLVDFLAEVLGKRTEIVLHDLKDVTTSIVYIKNGELTGRTLGQATTDFSLRLIESGNTKKVPYITNYMGKDLKGKLFTSSTFFIKNFEEDLIGLLCINTDTSEVTTAIELLKSMQPRCFYEQEPVVNKSKEQTQLQEVLQGNPKEIIQMTVERVMSDTTIPFSRLTAEEKLIIFERLNREGIFLMKKSVERLAEIFQISIPSCYRYIRKIKKES
ncbi:hypothetical protein RV11_GL000277 [Enterococcus phoeniculicola]|uniref:PAC domain-containing protein n=1 Tax=Enterococcus phoeniculicola ATCC BAA-412 TaxID=1158610 RepID=R3W8A4_9ENTE|nr:PAS domain-containing protein [Enterococcus phoeniculicola]EOL44021.1 hypothetical protein UC3_01651 [Enterococcus phoeniculicola ATCC BAA-412]EOT75123.1 hypothetical protein I589_02723 [Enterococcus phoeniculicola ATCC BAA-412]OJG71571.1 hypothetical protein RV11_GL000277 [Enterococcus phoeniculicola]